MRTQGKATAAATVVQVAQTQDGIVTYLVAEPPEAMPAVAPRDLERAWYHARAAAIAEKDGPARLFRFRRAGDEVTDLALTDTDARCWAEAVDVARGLDNLPGLSVCLRLLALVDLMTRARWAALCVALRPDGAEIDAALLRAAATLPLTREARFDESSLRAQLPHDKIPHMGRDGEHPASLPSGASA